MLADPRYRITELAPAWQSIVIDGAFADRGMAAWRDYLTAEEADRILDYVAHEARLGHARGERRIVRSP